MISIILPSRGRPKLLERCLQSLLATCALSINYEVIVRIDDDDPELGRYMDLPQTFQYLRGKRGEGYSRNDALIEECAKYSQGDIIMQYVDTAVMQTNRWDILMHEAAAKSQNGIFVMFPHITGGTGYQYCFPTISRKLYDLCGCFCLGQNPSVDRCWEAFALEYPQSVIEVPVTIEHAELRGSKEEDKTASETKGFYSELNADWGNRHVKHVEIGKQYADLVRSKL